MTYLAYGILPEQKVCQSCLARGLIGQPLNTVSVDGLSIVFASAPDAAAQPAVPELLAYARVIEALHKRCTVLPMRYGCLFDNESQLYDFLRNRQADFKARLRELDGCSELTIRVLSGAATAENYQPSRAVDLESTGAAYLAARRACYRTREGHRSVAMQLKDKVQQAFQGLFRDCRTEQSTARTRPIVTVHLLVPGEFTEPFRAAFQQFQRTISLKLRLSGPWPPYNFANCDERDCEKQE